ncbi:DUF4407 domain-containing protein [Nonomuraea sp. NPDC003707]
MKISKINRWLRSFAGCQEKVLDLVPHERARYAGLGGVVLAVAIMAMISMGIGLSMVTGGLRLLTLPVLPIWGLLILSLDRFLMSTTTSKQSGGHARKLWPRVLLSVVLGVVIAEPLLLGIFKPDIDDEIKASRHHEVVTRQSELARCNPVSGTKNSTTNDKRCRDLHLEVGSESPEVIQQKLSTASSEASGLQTTLTKDQTTYDKLLNDARAECTGAPGLGNTGEAGNGPYCQQRRKQAEDYRRDHRMVKNSRRLAELNGQIDTLNTQLRTAQSTYAAAINTAIKNDLTELRARQQEAGLAEHFEAMHSLAAHSGYTNVAAWGLRFFLIIVDSMPVALKIFGGQTSYDRLIADNARVAEETARRRNDAVLRRSARAQDANEYKSEVRQRIREEKATTRYAKKSAQMSEVRDRVTAQRRQRLLDEALASPEVLEAEWRQFNATERGGE